MQKKLDYTRRQEHFLFHNSVIKRRRKNRINSITYGGVTVNKDDDIAASFIKYFVELFTSSMEEQRDMQNIRGNIIQDESLQAPSKDEILSIIKNMRGNASPGPNGFNVTFYRATWSWIGDDIYSLVRSFYINKWLPDNIKKTNIVLIPKKSACLTPLEYRSISLCNVIYKIIAKSLALKMQPYLPGCMVDSQYAFVKGRRISENIILAHEIVHSFRQKNWTSNAFMLKLDLAKAFDRLEWSFIKYALRRIGFGEHFINLIAACIECPIFSIIINGQSFGTFKSSRGIRQGHPLSPYVFIVAINELTCMLRDAISDGKIQGIMLAPNTPVLHSLLFADDVIICRQASLQEAQCIKEILEAFCADSG